MTISMILSQLEGIGLAGDSDNVAKWCEDLDNELRRYLFPGVENLSYDGETDLDTDLFVGAPFDDLYFFYVAAKLFYSLRQTADYDNYTGQYNSRRQEYLDDFFQTSDYFVPSALTPSFVWRRMQARRSAIVHRLTDIVLWCTQVDQLARTLTRQTPEEPLFWTPDTELLLPPMYLEAYVSFCLSQMAMMDGDQTDYSLYRGAFDDLMAQYYGSFRRSNRPAGGQRFLVGV